MPERITDGKGRGFQAEVNGDNQLVTAATSQSIQHWTSKVKEQAFQIIGTVTLASGITTGLLIRNTSNDKLLTVTYVRHQIISPSGGTAIPNVDNYFMMAFDRTRVSGGIAATAVNVNEGSGVAAEVEAWQGAPVLSGTFKEIDRWYTKEDGDMNVFRKEGAVILNPDRTLELSYVGDQTDGLLYTRLSFLMVEM